MVILTRVCLRVSFILISRMPLTKFLIKDTMVKVKAHGIGVKIWGWIDDWLSGRRQWVTLNGRESN